jgi:hypothetical protein
MTSGFRFVATVVGIPCLAALGCGSSTAADSIADAAAPATSPGVAVSVSGQALALTGYKFPPAGRDDPVLVDGWELVFDRVLVTIDKVKMYANPDTLAADQSQTGPEVAEVDGPWAVDLHRSDPNNLQGKGGADEQAVRIAQLTTQDLVGGRPFPADGTRYGIGFELVTAGDTAKHVNLDAAAETDYAEMIQNQCAVFYAGTATFKGDKTDPNCYPDDRRAFPDEVKFRFCFKSPTTYLNCQNPENDPAKPLGDDKHERGIAFEATKQVVAQITIHVGDPFWDSVVHDSPTHFDQFAARAVGQPGTPTITLEDTKGVDYSAFQDAQGNPINWRYCVDPPTDVHPKLTGEMAFDPHRFSDAGVDQGPTGLRDYYDFTTYDQSTQAYLNSDGLCFVNRNYPSPR